MERIQEVAQLIKNSKYAVVFTGAGISVESGIPTFRGSQGLWSKYDPEEYAYIEAFFRNPSKVWEMLREMYEIIFGAKPNSAHKVLSKLEKMGYLKAVITQNIDGLHQAAGSENVIEFHGNCNWLICLNCGRRKRINKELIKKLPYPECSTCKRPLKPEVVFFGEPIPIEAKVKAEKEAKNCEVMLIIGTSGVVYPAAELPYLAKSRGAKIVEINLEQSSFTYSITDYFLQGKASEILEKLFDLLLI